MSKLLDAVREAVRTRHYSLRTEEAYLRWVREYILFCGKRHPQELGAKDVSAFVSHLAVDRQVSASTQTQALSALLFLYRERCATARAARAASPSYSEAGELPHLPSLLRHAHDRGGLRHPHRPRVARPRELRPLMCPPPGLANDSILPAPPSPSW